MTPYTYADFMTRTQNQPARIHAWRDELLTAWENHYQAALTSTTDSGLAQALPEILGYALWVSSSISHEQKSLNDIEDQYYALSANLDHLSPTIRVEVSHYLETVILPRLAPDRQISLILQLGNHHSTDSAEYQEYLSRGYALLPMVAQADAYSAVFSSALLMQGDEHSERRSQTMTQAWQWLEAVEEPWQKANGLSLLARLHEDPRRAEIIQQAVALAQHISDPYFKSTMLGTLARRDVTDPAQKQAMLDEALNIARGVGSVRPRLQAFYHPLQLMTDPQRAALLDEILEGIMGIESEYSRLGLLQYYADVVEGEKRQALCDMALQFADDYLRARALGLFIQLGMTELVPAMQQAVLAYLWAMRERARGQVLSSFMRRDILSVKVWGQAISDASIHLITDICRDWAG